VRAPKFNLTRANGMDLAHYDWAAGSGAPVVFCHATGFHGRCWDQVIRNMSPEVTAVALDMRGHGRSQQVPPPMHWRDFGEDVAALGEKLEWSGVLGVGHSMGGYAVTLAAALRPGTFRGLVLLDPVIMAPESYSGPWVPEHFARKRRRQWDSPDEMFERFQSRAPFNLWDEQVLRDYCDYALNERGELACPPEVEGSIYENCTMPESDISAALERIDIPVVVVRSVIEFVVGFTAMEASPTDPRLAQILPHGRDEHWRDVSHFIPMEQPERVAQLISAQD